MVGDVSCSGSSGVGDPEKPVDTTAIRDAALRCRAVLMDGLRTAGADAESAGLRQAAATHLLRAAASRMLRDRGVDAGVLDRLLPLDEPPPLGKGGQGGWIAGGCPIPRVARGGGSSGVGWPQNPFWGLPGGGFPSSSSPNAEGIPPGRTARKGFRAERGAEGIPPGEAARKGFRAERIDTILDAPALAEAWQPGNEEALGWFYQYFNEPDLDAFRGSRPPKVTAESLAAKTQLFTPRWIVRFLVENTLGRLWLQMHPDSRLAARLEYLVPPVPDGCPIPVTHAASVGCSIPVTHAASVGMRSRGGGCADSESRVRPVCEIRILDPACGTMHFGLVVFDLLVEMYREEMQCAGRPGWPERPSVSTESDIPAAILSHNLFGFDIDSTAVRLSAVTLYVKASSLNRHVSAAPLNLHCADVLRREDDLLPDSDACLSEAAAHALRSLYDVVVTNPPYLDSRDYDATLKSFIAEAYPAGKRNLYGAFLERCVEFLADGGRLGMVTPQTFMFISSFARLRALLRNSVAIETLVQGGLGTFPDAVVDAAFYVLRRENNAANRDNCLGRYFRLVRPADTQAKRQAFEQAIATLRQGGTDSRVFLCRQGDFDHLPGRPWVYWITPAVRDLFDRLPTLSRVAKPIVGLQTSDNFRFLRFWWEIFFRGHPDAAVAENRHIAFGCNDRAAALATGRKWFPHLKGGDFRRWYGNQEYVVNWANDGAEIRSLGIESGRVASRPQNMDYYFRPGVTWTHTSSRGLSVRILPPGFICNVEGMAAFQLGQAGSSLETLAIMNSSFARHVIDLLNPTVHFGGREVGDLPYPQADSRAVEVLESHVSRAVELARQDSREEETTWEFIQPPDWRTGPDDPARRAEELVQIERLIDDEVYALYGLGVEDRTAIENDLNGDADRPIEVSAGDQSRAELAHAWISYAVGVVMGRFRPGVEGSLGCGCFDPKTTASLRDLTVCDGIADLSDDGRDDLAERVMGVLQIMLGEKERDEVVGVAVGKGRGSVAGLRKYLAGGFFRRHLQEYRNRPVYWLVQSRERGYSAYLYYELLSEATLERLRGPQHLAGRLGEALRRGENALAADLQAFDESIERTSTRPDERGPKAGWRLEPDDGVLINAAPVHELLSPLWKEPADCWRRLSAGEYDWSFTARRYWPDRVLSKCRQIRSYAFAHGLDRTDRYNRPASPPLNVGGSVFAEQPEEGRSLT